MDVYTIQLARHRLATARNIAVIDTTVKTGISPFAPSWQMVRDYKSGVISEDRYTAMYVDRMVAVLRTNPDAWWSLANTTEPIAIACMCSAGTFCHRHILVGLFERYCKKRNIEFNSLGEIES